MNITQREVALCTNAFLKNMRMMQPRQFNVENFNRFCRAYVLSLVNVFSKSNPNIDINAFTNLCLEGV